MPNTPVNPISTPGTINVPDIATDYQNGRINTVTNAPGAQVPGAQNQLMGLLGPLLEYKLALERERRQPMRMAGGGGGMQMPQGPQADERGSGLPSWYTQGGPGRGLMMTKMIGGPQMVAGRVGAAPWDPAAAFSGYAPPGYNPYPQSASFAGPQGGAMTGAGASADIPSYGAGQSQLQALQGGPQDPFPHGSGQAFAAAQMEAARRRSDAEYAARRKQEDEG